MPQYCNRHYTVNAITIVMAVLRDEICEHLPTWTPE